MPTKILAPIFVVVDKKIVKVMENQGIPNSQNSFENEEGSWGLRGPDFKIYSNQNKYSG